jgi:ABC-2 type transport system ATP-binding protein
LDEAEAICDRVAIIDHGHVLAIGATREMVARHGCVDLQTLFLALTGRDLRA